LLVRYHSTEMYVQLVKVTSLIVTAQYRARQVSDNPVSLTGKVVKGFERKTTLLTPLCPSGT
jgi:hypothetical protein